MSIRRLILIFAAGSLTCASTAMAQDSQSIADIARQARQKQQAQATATSDLSASTSQPADPNAKPPAKATHVYTNDEIPEHTAPDLPSSTRHSSELSPTNYRGGKQPAEQWKSQILQMKHSIASLQKQIDTVQGSIYFAGGNYEKHVLYNDRQRQKEQQVENMKSQLAQQQKRLEDMQEEARHQGYSSAVYDP
jgi:hypothetical protein